jgi:hypothetical protein
MSAKIDDPIAASEQQWPEPDGTDKAAAEIALSLAALKFPLAAVAKIFNDQFGSSRRGRTNYMLNAVIQRRKRQTRRN